MLLKDIAKSAPGLVRIIGDENVWVRAVCSDSRKVVRGALFFCIPGMRFDAHDYAPQVKEAGAAAIVVDHELDVDIPQVLVRDVRNALSYMAAQFYGNPAGKLCLIGLTGTKGKTTTSFLIKSILEKMGKKVGLIGTVCSMVGDEELPATLTTPDSIDLQRLLLKMVDSGVTHVVMEVSAHALAMQRTAGMVFDVVGFTNLSQDHLDYFHTMEKYLQAKLRLFEPDMCRAAVYNCDDDATKALAGRGFTRAGISADSEVFAKDIEIGERGCQFMLTFHKRYSVHVSLRLAGIFNVYNALLAAGMCDRLGATGEQICEGLEAVGGVPGRIELLDTDTPYRVILDYAHSP
ncbi:MAG: UDP-N-acetylmuramoyl-L-alanyl-D-glutamate--2,6-diaminopimelate ligase, partial [Eubacteriales bacterium]|nr:UDP-N-acetylmuramoyl-L-alanyl-D-glutamate--2,6-diaminopimelate ligase [Eubacteriales bacterium]